MHQFAARRHGVCAEPKLASRCVVRLGGVQRPAPNAKVIGRFDEPSCGGVGEQLVAVDGEDGAAHVATSPHELFHQHAIADPGTVDHALGDGARRQLCVGTHERCRIRDRTRDLNRTDRYVATWVRDRRDNRRTDPVEGGHEPVRADDTADRVRARVGELDADGHVTQVLGKPLDHGKTGTRNLALQIDRARGSRTDGPAPRLRRSARPCADDLTTLSNTKMRVERGRSCIHIGDG